MRIDVLGLAGVLAVLGGPSMAEPIDGRTARDMLFRGGAVEVQVLPDDRIPTEQLALIEEVAGQQIYYAAVAVSPDDGVLSTATLAAANHHSIGAAEAAALDACNRMREGDAECMIVARVRPRGWDERQLQLSFQASDAFRQEYRRGRGPKAFAISPSTGRWAIVKGDNANVLAVEECNAQAERADCTVAVAD